MATKNGENLLYQDLIRGFTIIEVMTAVFVTIVGVVGIYGLVPKILSAGSINHDRFIASQLVGEGFEIVRNIRDSNVLAGETWNTGLMICVGGCEADYNDNTLVVWADRNLKTDDQGFYNYDSGTDTKFKRKITITTLEADKYLDVEVEVSWPNKYSPFKAEGKLYNWR